MQGTIECCHWRSTGSRVDPRHLPRVESVGAEHGVDSLHLRQRRTEKLTELAGRRKWWKSGECRSDRDAMKEATADGSGSFSVTSI